MPWREYCLVHEWKRAWIDRDGMWCHPRTGWGHERVWHQMPLSKWSEVRLSSPTTPVSTMDDEIPFDLLLWACRLTRFKWYLNQCSHTGLIWNQRKYTHGGIGVNFQWATPCANWVSFVNSSKELIMDFTKSPTDYWINLKLVSF